MMSNDELRRMINNIAVELFVYGCCKDRTANDLAITDKICTVLNTAYVALGY